MDKSFWKLVLSVMGIVLLAAGVVAGVFSVLHKDEVGVSTSPNTVKNTEQEEIEESGQLKTTIAVFGTDKGELRTDVIFVVSLDKEKDYVEVISVPRDTKVLWDSEQKAAMRETKGYSASVSKINEMLVHGGKENIYRLTIAEIEKLLDVKVDNYVIVSLDIFKEVIDAIGGVEVEVPQRMYYTDRSQGLYIDLQQGLQVLDGEHAEMFVRFRKYPTGDVARVHAQQLFMEGFIRQITKPSILIRVPKLINIVFDKVDTDLNVKEVLKYVSMIDDFTLSNVKFNVLPGVGQYENGVSYYMVNDTARLEMISARNANNNEVNNEEVQP